MIETGEAFSRKHFKNLMASFDPIDAAKFEVVKVEKLLDELMPCDTMPMGKFRAASDW